MQYIEIEKEMINLDNITFIRPLFNLKTIEFVSISAGKANMSSFHFNEVNEMNDCLAKLQQNCKITIKN